MTMNDTDLMKMSLVKAITATIAKIKSINLWGVLFAWWAPETGDSCTHTLAFTDTLQKILTINLMISGFNSILYNFSYILIA